VGYCGTKCQEKNWRWHRCICSWNQAYVVSLKSRKTKRSPGVLKEFTNYEDNKDKKSVSFVAGCFSPQELRLAKICNILCNGETVVQGLERLVAERRLRLAGKLGVDAKYLAEKGLPEIYRMKRELLEQLSAPLHYVDEATTPKNEKSLTSNMETLMSTTKSKQAIWLADSDDSDYMGLC